jgi:soluble P-type ATPase
MLREAALGVAVLGPEGLAVRALAAADVVVASIDALVLLRSPKRLIATLRC